MVELSLIGRLQHQQARARKVQALVDTRLDVATRLYNQEQFAKERKVYRVFIACPAYRWPLDPHTQASVQAAIAYPGLDCEFQAVVGDAHIERARAMLLMHYLRHPKQPEFFLNIDWDIEFIAEELYRMCARSEEHKVGVLGGPYPFKTDTEPGKVGVPVMRVKPGATMDEVNHLIDCDYVGSGFMLVQKESFAKLMKWYPELLFNANPDLAKDRPQTWAGWNPVLIPRPDWGEGEKELLSEDYSFCHRAAEVGIRVAVDLRMRLKHWDGAKVYELQMQPQTVEKQSEPNPEEKENAL